MSVLYSTTAISKGGRAGIARKDSRRGPVVQRIGAADSRHAEPGADCWAGPGVPAAASPCDEEEVDS